MKNVPLDGAVFARPYPSLDENEPSYLQFQRQAYEETLRLLLNAKGETVIHSIPAGAGSGKTRLLVALLTSLLRHGVPAEEIEAISFTNASSNEIRARHIGAALSAHDIPGVAPINLSFCTIHQHAIDLLKKLQPHLSGVGYYFEDAQGSAPTRDPAAARDKKADQDPERKAAVQLALYSSLAYPSQSAAMPATLAALSSAGQTGLMAAIGKNLKDREAIFVLDDLGNATAHKTQADAFIRQDAATHLGLGAFTNVGDGGPDFSIAVATDALLRLNQACAERVRGSNGEASAEKIRRESGLPRFMAIDEAQDLDFLQLLYLRALALNGVSLFLVGDPRQTLYEFRQAVSDLPFREDFLRDFMAGSGVKTSVSQYPLRTNYRCRAEIIDAAEQLSDRLVAYSILRNQASGADSPLHLRIISDPPAVQPGLPHDAPELKTEKNARAVQVIQGEGFSEDFFKEQEEAFSLPSAPGVGARALGALARLPEQKAKAAAPAAPKRKIANKKTPFFALGGGKNQAKIAQTLARLYDHAREGDKVAILARQGLSRAEIKAIEALICKERPDAKARLRLCAINPPKNSALSELDYWSTSNSLAHETPFSHLLVAAAVCFFFSFDSAASKQIDEKDFPALLSVFARSASVVECEPASSAATLGSIQLSLGQFFDAVQIDAARFFPDIDVDLFREQFPSLVPIFCDFVLRVLNQYGKEVIRRKFPKGGGGARVPCRFYSVAVDPKKNSAERAILPLRETKGYFSAMWRAISSTPFDLNARSTVLVAAGLTPESLTPNSRLNNLVEELDFFAQQAEFFNIQGPRETLLKENRAELIRERERGYAEFARLWKRKTRSYLRAMAQAMGKLVRENPDAPEITWLLAAAQEPFMEARRNARVSIYPPLEDSKKKTYGGLFEDLRDGIANDVQTAKKCRENHFDPDTALIELSTVHSAKGLEWDHVLFLFPLPNGQDANSSFKSFRDALYVAITRAKRTLTIVAKAPAANAPPMAKDTSGKVAAGVFWRWATEKGYFDRELDWADLSSGEKKPERAPASYEIFDETSHSELERSQACGMRHYQENLLGWSSMSPLTDPSYSFFFHSCMSSICASIAGQRPPFEMDLVPGIASAAMKIHKDKVSEDVAAKRLIAECAEQIGELMETMVPLYLMGDPSQRHLLRDHYAQAFARHLAAIACHSELFHVLDEASRRPDWSVRIEKTSRSLLRHAGFLDASDDESQDKESSTDRAKTAWLPILGIPDICVQGPDFSYVGDYKTVPAVDEDASAEDEALFERRMSAKTRQQINYYQGLLREGALRGAAWGGAGPRLNPEGQNRRIAEVMYVADATVFDLEKIPGECRQLPHIGGGDGSGFRAKHAAQHAKIVCSERFDNEVFDSTADEVRALRSRYRSATVRPIGMFVSRPISGGTEVELEITAEECKRCPSGVHCALNKSFLVEEGP